MTETAAQNGQPNPTVARIMLVEALKDMADRSPLGVPEVARMMGIDESTLGRWLKGQKANFRPMDIQSLCAAYGYPIDHPSTVQLVALAQAAKQRGFVQRHSWFGQYRFDIFLRLERDSSTVRSYQGTLIPGQLQTPAYIEAVVRATLPEVTNTGVAERVRLRMDRQAALRRPHNPVQLHAVMDEAVIRRRLADSEAWHEQLKHLHDASHWPNVTIRIIPDSAGPHEGTTGSFVLFSFDGATGAPIGPIAYQETTVNALYADAREETTIYEARFERLMGRALDPATSSDMIAEATRVTVDKVLREV